MTRGFLRILYPICCFFIVLFFTECSNSKDSSAPENTTQFKSETDSLNDYISNYPNDIQSLALRSRRYLNNANLPYADADANAILELDSLNHDGLLLKGEANYLSNSTRLSRDYWLRCVEQHPDEIECRLKLAELYSIVMQYDRSTELVNKVMDLDPEQSIAYFIKGMNIRDTDGDTALALSYIQKSIDIDPTYFSAIDMAAVMTAAQNNPLALSYYDRLLELQPNNSETYYKIGMFNLNSRDFNGALEDYSRALSLNPQHKASQEALIRIRKEL